MSSTSSIFSEKHPSEIKTVKIFLKKVFVWRLIIYFIKKIILFFRYILNISRNLLSRKSSNAKMSSPKTVHFRQSGSLVWQVEEKIFIWLFPCNAVFLGGKYLFCWRSKIFYGRISCTLCHLNFATSEKFKAYTIINKS